MKPEEAMEILNNTAWLGTDNGIKVYPAVKVAAEALQKQIPMKPALKLHENRVPGEQEEYYCPTCDEWISWEYTRFKHCYNCGQAIDWTEDE